MNNILYGTICGDIIGSYYEIHRTKNDNDIQLIHPQSRFTDDTVCTLGVADAILHSSKDGIDFGSYIQEWCINYPNRGYGHLFRKWIHKAIPYNSFGNGSAMRISPIAYYANSVVDCRILAQMAAECSHNHLLGIRGAQAVAECIFMILHGAGKVVVNQILQAYYPDFNTSLAKIKPSYHFDSSCPGSVPVAIQCFLESKSYIDAVTKAVAMGGDADTLGAIAGSIAYAYYKYIPEDILDQCKALLDDEMIFTIKSFDELINEL